MALDRKASKGDGFEASDGDAFAGHFAEAVGAFFDAEQGLLDFVEGILVFSEDAEGEVAVISIRAGIALVHAAAGGIGAFGRTADCLACGAGHGIDDVIAEVE